MRWRLAELRVLPESFISDNLSHDCFITVKSDFMVTLHDMVTVTSNHSMFIYDKEKEKKNACLHYLRACCTLDNCQHNC